LKYSNLGFGLIGQVIEKAGGVSYSRFIERNILEPLGLGSTTTDFSAAIEPKLATAYGVPFAHERAPLWPRESTKALAAAVGIHTTAEDMCRFAAAHFFGSPDLLSEAAKREMQRAAWTLTEGYDSGVEFGLGCEIIHVNDHRLVGHSGHLAGYLTATFFDPDKRLAVSVMANSKDAPSVKILRGIFEAMDWFERNTRVRVPARLTRFNVRARNAFANIEVIAGSDSLVAIDPDDWEPFTWLEHLEYVDPHTLRFITPGSIFNEGELIEYRFSGRKPARIRCAGGTLLPETDYYRLATAQNAKKSGRP
jgi:D-alanyl-D-alanine carboxypeptidase